MPAVLSQVEFLKLPDAWVRFVTREWLLIVALIALVGTSVYLERVPSFLLSQFELLFVLLVLFVTVKGLENNGLVSGISPRIETGKLVSLKVVGATFFLSMIVTNDVSLLIMVPLTLALDTTRKDVLVILEALAANAGSALTPFGNPQNLYIYWSYRVHPLEFIRTIAPLSTVFLGLLVIAAFVIKTRRDRHTLPEESGITPQFYLYGLGLVLVILIILRVIPIPVGFAVLLYALLFDRKTLRVDYALLVTFFFFFGVSDNLKTLLAPTIERLGHVFLVSAISSQVISNVPTTLLLARVTGNWQALLWGASVGGFGSLVGSLANVIAYRLYVADQDRGNLLGFLFKFLAIGYVAFAIGIGLYLLVEKTL